MKKIYGIFLLICHTSLLLAGQYEFSYNFTAPSVIAHGDYHKVILPGAYLTGKTGEPALPYQPVKLILAPGEEAIGVYYAFEDEIQVPGKYMLLPQQPSRPYSEGVSGEFVKDMAVYSSTGTYPEVAWGEYTTQFLAGHSILLASFTPVRYIPSSGTLSWFRTVTVTVITRPTEKAQSALQNLSNKPSLGRRVETLAQNPEVAAAYAPANNRDEGYDVLVITPEAFSASFEPLINLYLVRGLKAETVTTEYIAANADGADQQEKIRNYIIQEYQQNGIEYVLLGGDVEHIPYRGFYCYVQSGFGYEDINIPADLYYSALDGNWNTDSDGYWGEIGEDDLLPEVAVARFPFSTQAQLNRLLNKTIMYQDEPVEGELHHPLLAGEELYQNPLTYGEDYLELLIGYRTDNGYTTSGIPQEHTFTKMYDHLSYWGGYELINEINQGHSFIHHAGHANQTYVMRLGISDITNSNFTQVNGVDHNYSLIYTHGCLCGAFDENDCIGEAMVCIDNFAVAGAFNSRYGWFNEGQTEGPSAHLHREFVDALYNDKESRIGMAHMVSKIETSPWVNAPGQWEEGALRWCFYSCNILGDPVLGVWTDEPMDVEADYPEEILPATTQVPVTVISNGMPLEGATCVIMAGGEMIGTGVTDAFGDAVISVPGGFYGLSEADLIVSGYNCLPHYFPLSILVGTSEGNLEALPATIYPNPFSGQANIAFDLERPGRVELEFYTVAGQLIGTKSFEGEQGRNSCYFPELNWPQGMIVVKIHANGKYSYYRIFHAAK